MYAKLAECYYHPGRLASQTCQECGANICRDCAVKDERGRILCVSCANEALKLEHKEYRKFLKAKGGRFTEGREFVLPSALGIVIAAAFIVILCRDNSFSYDLKTFSGILALFFLAFMFHCIPYGVIMANDLIMPKYRTLYDRIGIKYFTYVLSMIFGWFSFFFYLVRFLKRRKKHNKNNS